MNSYIGSVLRHALSGVGGFLLTIGVEQAASDNLVNALVPVVGGFVTWLGSQGWSLIEKRLRK